MNVRNLTSRKITVKAKSIVYQVVAGNEVPPMLAQENSQESEKKGRKKTESSNLYSEMKTKTKLTKNQLQNIDKIDLSGIKDWNGEDQKEVKN